MRCLLETLIRHPAGTDPARAGNEPGDGLGNGEGVVVGTRACGPWLYSQRSAAPLLNYLIPDAERSVFREGDGGFSIDLLNEK